MKKRAGEEKGVVLLLTFMIMTTLCAVTVAFLYMTSVRTKGTGYDIISAKAFWVAEAGLQQAAYKLKTDASYRSSPAAINGNLGDGSYSVSVTASGNDYNVVSRGSVGLVNRKVSCLMKGGLIFFYAGFGNTAATMGSNGDTDSYDSGLGRYNVGGNKGHEGDVGTNGNIALSSPAYIDGDASTGPSGTFNTQSAVYGLITHTNNLSLPTIAVPASLTGLADGGTINNTRTIPAGNYKFTAISPGSKIVTITGPANIYLTSTGTAISLSGSGTIAVSASSTGPVVIYTAGNCTIGGGGVVNGTYSPQNFQLFSSAGGTSSITSSAEFYGAVYAPLATLSLTGSGKVYGSFIGKSITINGTGGLHYDKALSNLSIASGSFTMRNWQEVFPAT